MSPGDIEALRAADDREFLWTLSRAIRQSPLTLDELAAFFAEVHRRGDLYDAALAERDARRRADIALYDAPAASSAKN